MSTVSYPHISLDPNGVPRITATGFKVVMLAMHHVASGWSAEVLHQQFPDLSLGQIHSALAYYYDHRGEFDQEIERRDRDARQLRAELENRATM